MSFVDLKGAINDIPKAEGGGKMESSDAQITSLKDELVLAQASKILCGERVK